MTTLDLTVILWRKINSKECFVVIIFVDILLPFSHYYYYYYY